MDNISFHRTQKVKELIEFKKCNILFFPTYSPDLNPIEHYWFKIKYKIRNVIHEFSDFSDTATFVLKNINVSTS